jgi:hypothetical protein
VKVPGASFVAAIPGEVARFRRKLGYSLVYMTTLRGFLAEQPVFDDPGTARAVLKAQCGSEHVPVSIYMLYEGRWWHRRTAWTVPAFEPVRWFTPDTL